jgi:hypothetical protein
MTEDATQPAVSVTPSPTDIVADAPTARRCPWCSELLPEDATERCPACNANLVAEGEARIAGLTEVEGATAARVRRADAPKRSKLLSWISGDVDEESSTVAPSAPDALDPPDRDVRREMLRLKLEAQGLTVAADGSIEFPTDAARPAGDAPEGDAEAVAAPLDTATTTADAPAEATEEILKAS